jgi:predicted N-acetyltransferase YhbS
MPIAHISDAPAILALQKLAFLAEARLYDDFSIPPLTQTLPELEAEFGRMRFFKVELDGALAGSVRGELADGVCRVGRLIVHPERQRRGLGSALMRELEESFAQECERFEIFTGSKSVGNLRLYARLGYRAVEERALPSGPRLVFMEKKSSAVGFNA